MRLPLTALLLLTCLGAAREGEFRRFSDGHKLSVYARPVAVIGEGRVLLENEAGARFETPLEVLYATNCAISRQFMILLFSIFAFIL